MTVDITAIERYLMDPNTPDPQQQPGQQPTPEQQPTPGAQQPPAQPEQPIEQPMPQQPTPEQSVVPQPIAPPATPLQQPAADQTMPQAAPQPTAPQPPKKSKKALIIVLVVLGFIFIAGVVTAATLAMFNGAKESAKKSQTAADKAAKEGASDNNVVTAQSESDFSVVCEGGTVKNAAEAATPYKITTFYNNEIRDKWTQQSVGYGESYYPDYEKPAEIGVVACLDAKSGSEAKATTCEFTSDGEALTLDYYSLQYQLTYYAAKTGEKVGVNDSVAAPATTCPFSAFIKDGESRLFADPDDATVEELHKAFSSAS